MDELVNEFLSGEDITMGDGLFHDPERVWEAVLRLSRQTLTQEQVALLAAGPLEDLLVHHGAKFISRVEDEAQNSPSFANLLGGVWQSSMPQEIWTCVETARGGKCW